MNWLPTGNIIGNSQTAKQMKNLRLKYEITLKAEIFAAKLYLQFCWAIHTYDTALYIIC